VAVDGADGVVGAVATIVPVGAGALLAGTVAGTVGQIGIEAGTVDQIGTEAGTVDQIGIEAGVIAALGIAIAVLGIGASPC